MISESQPGRLEQRSWENQDGEKRSKVEVMADEVGPSLRWATATVHKAERSKPDQPSAGATSGSNTWGSNEEPF